MPQIPQRPSRRPPNEPGFFQRVVVGNLWAILTLLCLLLVVVYLFRNRKDEVIHPAAPPEIVLEASPVPTAPLSKTPAGRREAAVAEPVETHEEDPTPEFVTAHKEKMLNYLTVGVAGVKHSIPRETDPRKIQEMKDRVAMGERLIKKLEGLDPKDKSTWFFLERNQGVPRELDLFIVPRATPKTN
jgi:hypothetical protein